MPAKYLNEYNLRIELESWISQGLTPENEPPVVAAQGWAVKYTFSEVFIIGPNFYALVAKNGSYTLVMTADEWGNPVPGVKLPFPDFRKQPAVAGGFKKAGAGMDVAPGVKGLGGIKVSPTGSAVKGKQDGATASKPGGALSGAKPGGFDPRNLKAPGKSNGLNNASEDGTVKNIVIAAGLGVVAYLLSKSLMEG